MDVLHLLPACAVAGILAAPSEAIDWVTYEDQTSTRLVADPSVGAADVEEKDMAWGDVDDDGDVDLVIVRKQPFTSTGRRTNVLLLNEDGVLVDRTVDYASASDVPGDEGFLTPTNDRDVVLVDVNADGFLDIVTATTHSDGQPKHIGHPRVYVNLGIIDGTWQGFRHEDARFPQLFTVDKLAVNPRFNAVAAGDVTGDGVPDLYFADGDLFQPAGFDLNDRLLANDGNGFFTDVSDQAMTEEMLDSSLGMAAAIVDMNGDGANDVIKVSGLSAPVQMSIAYNSINTPGVFDVFDVIYQLSATFMTVADLNLDGRLDVTVTDDGTDRYLLNQGNGPDGLADFTALVFANSSGFGGNSVNADLDRDGLPDVVITDIDVDIPGCSRGFLTYRNGGDLPQVSMIEEPPGGFVTEDRSGTHDVAAFDLNGDDWLDLVVGRCEGTSVWINVPPIGLSFDYFGNLPRFVATDVPTMFEVLVQGLGGVVPELGSGRIHVSVDGGPFVATPMQEQMGNLYLATLPAVACAERIRFYVSADTEEGATFSDPPGAPIESYTAYGTGGTALTFLDEIEGDVSSWTVENEGLSTGAWEQADPNGTVSFNELAAPEDDATPDPGTMAFVTENGLPGDGAAVNDVDGGPTTLISPVLDLAGTDAEIRYARWFFCNDEGLGDADFLTVDVSNDGGVTWTPVPEHTTGGTREAGVTVWQTAAFVVGDYVAPTGSVRVRFSTADLPNNSITEAGIDDFRVSEFLCTIACPADIDGDDEVGFSDLLEVLSSWGPCVGCPADVDGDLVVGFEDLLQVLSNWGPCSG